MDTAELKAVVQQAVQTALQQYEGARDLQVEEHVRQLQEQVDSLEESLSAQQEETHAAQQAMHAARDEMAAVQAQLEAQRAAHVATQHHLNGIRVAFRMSLEAPVENVVAEADAIRRGLDDARNRLADLSKALELQRGVERSLVEKKQQLESALVEMRNGRDAAAELGTAARREATALQARLQSAQQELSLLAVFATARGWDISKEPSAVAYLRGLLQQVEQELEGTRTEAQRLTNHLTIAEQQRDTSHADGLALREEANALQEELKGVRFQLSVAQERANEASGEAAQAQEQLEEARLEREAVRAEAMRDVQAMRERIERETLARVEAEQREAVLRRTVEDFGKVSEVAHQHGWNGVTNSKLLVEFLRGELEALAKLKAEGVPGQMHAVDRAFYDLTVKERDAARAMVAAMKLEQEALHTQVDQQAAKIRELYQRLPGGLRYEA